MISGFADGAEVNSCFHWINATDQQQTVLTVLTKNGRSQLIENKKNFKGYLERLVLASSQYVASVLTICLPAVH